MRRAFFAFAILAPLAILGLASVWRPALWAFVVVAPVILVGLRDAFQTKHTLLRNFPVLAHGRYLVEKVRPAVQQYFIEHETQGMPIPREFRSVIYQRAKDELDTVSFGTRRNVYEEGYEWMLHSIRPVEADYKDLHLEIGGEACEKPYKSALLNISAMSYGSLSAQAVMSLNKGARLGGFAHNTGEGGVSPFHLEHGGDLIWQVGTGYFGCRASDGGFDPDAFAKNATRPEVKMVELKLSQGAKPGKGGILPACKVTPEIAAIRGVPVGKAVISPPYHKEFDTPEGLLQFIQKLRKGSGGKPVGFKLCVGYKHEFFAICKAMVETGIKPDYIAVDGGEGATGAAPLEFSNSVGSPLDDGLAFVINALRGFDLKKDIRVMASGKVFTAFHMLSKMAIGADACYSARSFMLALGCIHALECNRGHCPTGITTHDPALTAGLVVEDKAKRVKNFHADTIYSLAQLLGAVGLTDPANLMRHHVKRRVSWRQAVTYDDLFPDVKDGDFLEDRVPEDYARELAASRPDTFAWSEA